MCVHTLIFENVSWKTKNKLKKKIQRAEMKNWNITKKIKIQGVHKTVNKKQRHTEKN